MTLSPINGSTSRARKESLLRYSSSGSCDLHGTQSTPKHTFSSFGRRRNFKRIPQGEFRKARPPTFDEESNTSQEAKAWFLGMKKYF